MYRNQKEDSELLQEIHNLYKLSTLEHILINNILLKNCTVHQEMHYVCGSIFQGREFGAPNVPKLVRAECVRALPLGCRHKCSGHS